MPLHSELSSDMKGVFIIFLFSLVSYVRGDPPPHLANGLVYAPAHASVNYYSYPRYAFNYAVNDPHTGDNKAQWEKREGDVVKGAYSLVEPDGSVRLVEYFDDGTSGFNAIVKRIGPNVHPVTTPHVPIYKAPIPVLSHGPGVSGPITIGPVAHLSHLAHAPLMSGPLGGGPISSIPLIKIPINKHLVTPEPAYVYDAPIIREPAHKIGLTIATYSPPIIHKPLFYPGDDPIVKQVHVSEIAHNDHSYSPLKHHHLPKPSDDYNHHIHTPFSVSPWDPFIKDVPADDYLEPDLLHKHISPEPELYYNSEHLGGYH